MERECLYKLLDNIKSKLTEKENDMLDSTIDTLFEYKDKIEKAKRFYLKSLQKHNEKNEKMDDTAIMMYTALLDDVYDDYE